MDWKIKIEGSYLELQNNPQPIKLVKIFKSPSDWQKSIANGKWSNKDVVEEVEADGNANRAKAIYELTRINLFEQTLDPIVKAAPDHSEIQKDRMLFLDNDKDRKGEIGQE